VVVWIGRAALLLLLVSAAVWFGGSLGPDWSWLPPVVCSTLVVPVLVDRRRRRDREKGRPPRLNGTGANGQDTTL
jgi:hypothetical protein